MAKRERQEAFILAYRQSRGDVTETAKHLGVSEPTVYNWRRELRSNGLIA